MLAISSDDAKTLRAFREKYAPTLPFVADTDGTLIKLFGVKTPLINFANRTTFVISAGRKIAEIQSGGDAIDASKALGAAQVCGG